MNKNQAKGSAKIAAGKIQRSVGELVGSHRQEGRGIVKQIKGTAQRRVGDVQAAIKAARKRKTRSK